MALSVTTVKYVPTDPRLGRHVEHDSRSRNFPFKAAAKPPDKTIFWADSAPILDQKDLGGCVGWTGADILNTVQFSPVRSTKNKGQFYGDKEGLAFYKAATVADSIKGTYPPEDTGSSGLGLAKALKKLGLIDSYTHAFSWSAYLTAIAKGPVAVGTLWTNQMFDPDNSGVVTVGAITDDTVAGGHEYSLRGRDSDLKLNLCRNHWSKTWNPKSVRQKLPGEFWLTDADLKLLLSNQGDITVLHGVGM